MIVLATLAGILCGVVLSVIPGLHLALVFTLCLGLMGQGVASACFVGSAVGVAIYLKRLGGVYHPNAASGVASLDPALRLTAEGKGPLAIAICKKATDMALIPISIFTVYLLMCFIGGFNAASALSRILTPVGALLIAVWFVYTSLRSKAPLTTFLTMVVIGLFGYTVLNHPGMTGSEHQMAPIMSGLFGIPIMLALFKERSKTGLPAQSPENKVKVENHFALQGATIGCATGFLAGLGTQSLISLAINKEQSNEEVLMLTSSGEASNDMMALLLVIVASMGRSGEAVLLNRVLPQPDLAAALAVLMAIGIGAWVGREALDKFQKPYLRLMQAVPVHVWALLVLGLALGQVLLHHSQFLALGFTLTGVLLSSWARANELPLQVSFAALALPILAYSLGVVPQLNSVLF